MNFTFIPNVGASPILFGMTPEKVRGILGEPHKTSTTFNGHPVEEWDKMSVGYSADYQHARQVLFLPRTNLNFEDQNLFTHPDPLRFVSRYGVPKLFVGFVIFPELGIKFSGFHDGDIAQMSIAIVIKGYWDAYRDLFEPFGQRDETGVIQ